MTERKDERIWQSGHFAGPNTATLIHEPPKFCVDCKHMTPGFNCTRQIDYGLSMVTGERRLSRSNHYCVFERDEDGDASRNGATNLCGPRGRYFEPKDV